MAGVQGPVRQGRHALRALAAGAVAVILAGCSSSIGGQGAPDPVQVPLAGKPAGYTPSGFEITYAQDDDEADQVARDAFTDVIAYFNSWYPDVFGHDFQPPAHYYSIGPDEGNASGCMSGPDDQAVVNNAFYCPSGDEITYWRPLLTAFDEEYGDVVPAMMLAHEMGHALQQREDLYDARTIVQETQADCFAGAWARWIADGNSPHFKLDAEAMDEMLLGWAVHLPSPVGSDPDDPMQHGSAFDRVSAVQEGYEQGPQACRDNFNDQRLFTSMEFTADNQSDDGQGNGIYDDTITAAIRVYDAFYAEALESLGATWSAPRLLTGGSTQSSCAAEEFLTYCAADNSVVVTDESALREMHARDGDFATMTAVGLVYGIAAIAELGYSLDDPNAMLAASCLTGAVAGELIEQNNPYRIVLSPGDFDEATVMLLTAGSQNPVVDTGDQSAFARLDAYRAGVNGGIGNCGV